VNAELAQREIALAAVAFLAVVAVVAGLHVAREGSPGSTRAAAASTPWYDAQAAPYSFPAKAKRTACGQPATDAVLGVAHPVLPCGAKVVIRFRGRDVLTQVVDRGTGASGRDFELTRALARRLGMTDVQPIQWRFAQPGG
jgi:rare lipoprotein A (peptidoglycan hydrolase)